MKLQDYKQQKQILKVLLIIKVVVYDETIDQYATAINNLPSGDLTIEGQQIITGILTGTVDEFDTVYSISDGSNWDTVHNKLSNPADLPTGMVWCKFFKR